MRWIQANLPNAAEKTTTIVAWQCKYCHLVPHSHSSSDFYTLIQVFRCFNNNNNRYVCQTVVPMRCIQASPTYRHTICTAICCLAIRMPYINIWMPGQSTDLSCTLYEHIVWILCALIMYMLFLYMHAHGTMNGANRFRTNTVQSIRTLGRSWFFHSISLALALVISSFYDHFAQCWSMNSCLFEHSNVSAWQLLISTENSFIFHRRCH